jgi:NADH:ubiquinone oxidoreductase subunit 6 (subunit J)
MSSVLVGLLALLILVGALWVVTLRNLFRAALSLGLVLLGVAALFIVLEAEFLAFVQVLVYVGAILTLIVFAVMLTARLQGSPEIPASRQRLLGALTAGGLFAALVGATRTLVWPRAPAGEAVPLAALGQQLVTTLVLPFEVVSLVFVAAMIGAIAIAAPKRPGSSP